jgi:predicted PurR-regulated permease PerM
MSQVTNRSLFFLLLYVFAALILGYIFSSFIPSILLGSVLVILLSPINSWVQRRVGQRTVASFLMTFLVLLLVLAPVSLLGYRLSGEISTVQAFVQDTNFSSVSTSLNEYLGTSLDFQEFVLSNLERFQGLAASEVPGLIGGVTDFTVKFVIMVFVLYYGFKDGSKIRDGILSTVPLQSKYKERLESRFRNVLNGVLYGQLLVSFIQGLIGGIAFWLFGFNSPVFWGIIMILLGFIPVLGTPLIWGPAGLYLVVQGSVSTGVAFLIFNAIITMNVDNLIKPKLIGDRSEMHPLLVLLSIFGGLQWFGVIGFIIGPILVALAVLILQFYVSDFMPQQGS